MNKRREYVGLDYFKLIAAFLVVAVHTSPLHSISETSDFILTRIIARIAVPFFFMLTGYFVVSPYLRHEKIEKGTIRSFVNKICKLYLVAILLYIPINIYNGYLIKDGLIIKLVKDIVFNGTIYHLWYLPAAITGTGLVYLLTLKRSRFFVYSVVTILYIIGLFGDSYYGIGVRVPGVESIYNKLFMVFNYTRNGLLFAPIFIVMGGVIGNSKEEKKINKYILGFVVSMALLLTEGLLLRNFLTQRHDSMYLFLLPSMYFLFCLLLQIKGNSKSYLRSLPMLIYILHPMAIIIVRGIGKVFKIQSILIDNSIIHYILVSTLSLVISMVLISLRPRIKSKTCNKGRAWVEIDLKNLRHNAIEMKRIMSRQCTLMAVVKANAYGHGSIKIASELNKIGVRAFGVATITEGINLRKNGIKGEILILGYTNPEDFSHLIKYNLIQTVVDYNYAQVLNQYGNRVTVHIKIDTGMNRLGENHENLSNIINIFECQNLKIDGIYTHLSTSDSLYEDDILFTRLQIERFNTVVNEIKSFGYNSFKVHIQSSYGVLNYPGLNFDYARIGIALYGVLSSEDDKTLVSVNLRPVLLVKARIALIRNVNSGGIVGYGQKCIASKDMKIAVVSIGYADGIPRNLSNTQSTVLVKSQRARIIGKICMDQMIIDITDIQDVMTNDIVTIIGKDGHEVISCGEISKKSDTINNELLSRLGSRLEHCYIK